MNSGNLINEVQKMLLFGLIVVRTEGEGTYFTDSIDGRAFNVHVSVCLKSRV